MDNKWRFALIVLVIFAIASWFISSMISGFSGTGEPTSGNIALVQINGIITVGKGDGFFETVASSTEISNLIEKADKNPRIKAIILEISSGGGSPVGSAEIANAVKKTEKLTVAVIKDIGASGAYWVASSADIIVANELSFVGSVGVRGSYL